jgi:hypothetical protein
VIEDAQLALRHQQVLHEHASDAREDFHHREVLERVALEQLP